MCFHSLFVLPVLTYHSHHPAIKRVKEILESGELGKIRHVDAVLSVPNGFFGSDDIRFDYDLGGGALMDMGCKPLLLPSQ